MEDLSDDEGDGFQPLEVMPTSRLTDIAALLDRRKSSVVNIDACLPPKEVGERVLQTLLIKISPCVKTLSLRFNILSPYSIDLLTSWIATNDHIETLYIMGSGIDEKSRSKLEDAWRRKLAGHRTTNMGYTMLRVAQGNAQASEA